MDFRNTLLAAVFLFTFLSISHGQIETGKVGSEKPVKNEEKKKEDKAPKPVRPINYDPATSIYFGGSYGASYRMLEENDNLFGQPLGEKEHETPLGVGGFTVGVRSRVGGHWFLDFGLAIARNGEKYAYAQPDSMYKYTNRYTYFAVPLRIQYIVGQRWKFISGVGIQPQMLLGYRNETSWRTSEGVEDGKTNKSRDPFNFFTVAALANLGVQWQFGANSALYLYPEARVQLSNSFLSQQPYIHRGTYFGLQAGLIFGI